MGGDMAASRFTVAVMDGDRVVRGPVSTTTIPTVSGDDLDVWWGHGPPPAETPPEYADKEAYVDLDTGDIYADI